MFLESGVEADKVLGYSLELWNLIAYSLMPLGTVINVIIWRENKVWNYPQIRFCKKKTRGMKAIKS